MNSTEKTMAILKKLGEEPYEFSLTELSRVAECGKSGAYKILSVLVKMGFVIQKTNKKYCVGSAIHYLGNVYDEKIVEWETLKPHMEKIRDITGETVTFGVREGNTATIVYKVESKNLIRLKGTIGKKLPINCSAIGKLLAAYEDFEVIEEIISENPLIKRTPKTITDINLLKEEYSKIRNNGYAISDEESTVGAIGVGAPIFDVNGNVWACLCVGGPKMRVTEKELESFIMLIVEEAKELSHKLKYLK